MKAYEDLCLSVSIIEPDLYKTLKVRWLVEAKVVVRPVCCCPDFHVSHCFTELYHGVFCMYQIRLSQK